LSKHRAYLVKKAKIPEPDFDILIRSLLDNVIQVPFEDFRQEYDHAMHVMETIDENDSPFLAVGLALGIPGIWT
jgi:predicted nucleic acid-binding protein